MSSTNSGKGDAKRRRIQEEEKEMRTRERREGSKEDNTPRDPNIEESSEQGMEDYEDIINIFDLLEDEEFFEQASRLDDKEWLEKCQKLLKMQNEDRNAIEEWNTPGELCERCEDTASKIGPIAAWVVVTSQRALWEYSRRYRRALRELRLEEEAKEEIAAKSRECEEKLRKLEEEKREIVRERDSLRKSLAASEKERGRERRIPTPPPGHRDEGGNHLLHPERGLNTGHPRGTGGMAGKKMGADGDA